MVRSHGRCQKGQRLFGHAPYGHWRTSTFVAGLRHDGVIAPLVLDCPMNGLIFQTYVARCLAPELKPGDTVIMDNLGSHKSQAVKQAIRQRGAHLLFLPPYSPDLNPIEALFLKLKILLRAAAERNRDDLWDRIGAILDLVTPQECQNFFRHAGYA